MTDAYLIEMDDQGHSTYYLVNEATFKAAKAAEDADPYNDEALAEWYNDLDHPIAWNSFQSIRDFNQHLTENGLTLKDEIKGYLY